MRASASWGTPGAAACAATRAGCRSDAHRTAPPGRPYDAPVGGPGGMMGRRTRDLLIAAACGAAVAAPALGQGAPAGSFKAQDAGYSGVWRANGTEANTLTVAPGGTVTFGYPSGGSSAHNVKFTDRNPDCTGLPDPTDFQGSRPGWSGSCRFDQPGTYAFMCGFHPDMTGSVVVEAAPMPTS